MNRKRAMSRDYEIFSEALLTERLYLDPYMDFGTLCRRLGLRRRTLDKRLAVELGFHGQEILEKFRQGDIRKLLLLHI